MKMRDLFNRIHFFPALLASYYHAFRLVIVSSNVVMRFFQVRNLLDGRDI
ncbi:MAG: hypothetical protein ACUVTN_00130 [Thermodesulfobacteriota bacterium]